MPQAPRRKVGARRDRPHSATSRPGDELWDEWDRLVRTAHEPDPVHRAAVLRIPDPLRPGIRRILIARAGGAAVAGAALRAVRRGGLVHLDQLIAHPNRYGPGLPWTSAGMCDALADVLAGAPGDVLHLGEVPAGWGLHDALSRRLRGVHVAPDDPVHRLDLTVDPYSARRRRDVRRALRRAREGGAEVSRAVVARPVDARAALPSVMRLLAGARLGAPLDRYAAGPPGSRYLAAALDALAGDGALRVSIVEVDGRPVAAAVAAVLGDHAAGIRTAVDRDVAPSSAGWACQIDLVDRLRVEGVRHMDVGSGGDAHKAGYATARRTVAMIAPLSARGRAAVGAWRARRWLASRGGGR